MSTTTRGKWKNRVATNSVLIAAVAVVLYTLGFTAYVFLIAAAAITGLALGEHYRSKPNLNANRVAYVVLFASWIGLVVFLVLGALVAKTGLLESVPFPLVAGATIVPSLVIGGAIGDWVGRRRGYKIPNRS